jgi:hypothetical protein
MQIAKPQIVGIIPLSHFCKLFYAWQSAKRKSANFCDLSAKPQISTKYCTALSQNSPNSRLCKVTNLRTGLLWFYNCLLNLSWAALARKIHSVYQSNQWETEFLDRCRNLVRSWLYIGRGWLRYIFTYLNYDLALLQQRKLNFWGTFFIPEIYSQRFEPRKSPL